MSEISALRSRIREFIQHPRRLDPLLREKPNWNKLASAFDTIADTEMGSRRTSSYPSIEILDSST